MGTCSTFSGNSSTSCSIAVSASAQKWQPTESTTVMLAGRGTFEVVMVRVSTRFVDGMSLVNDGLLKVGRLTARTGRPWDFRPVMRSDQGTGDAPAVDWETRITGIADRAHCLVCRWSS